MSDSVLALVILYMTEEGPLSAQMALDTLAWVIAAGGLVIWAVIRVRFRRQQPQT